MSAISFRNTIHPIILLCICVVIMACGFSSGNLPVLPNPENSLIASTTHRIAFIASDTTGSIILAMNADGSGLTQLTQDFARIDDLAWSPDGTEIAFIGMTMGGNDEDIYIVHADGSGLRDITNSPYEFDYQLTWSPDGKKILFVSGSGGDMGFYTIALSDGEVSFLTKYISESVSAHPTWSPDGAKIAFGAEQDDNTEIYVMNLDGSDLKNITNSPAIDDQFHWSRDGKKLVYVSNLDGDEEIYIVKADGSGKTNITNDMNGNHAPAWSPDGKQIAFVSYRDGGSTPSIYVMDENGQNVKRVTTSVMGFNPTFSPDGTLLAFDCRSNKVDNVCVIGVDGRGLKTLTNDARRPEDITWAPR